MFSSLRLSQVISKYYSRIYSSSHPGYYVTPEYRRLMKRRFDAFINQDSWQKILSEIRIAFKEFDVVDRTDLHLSNCYSCAVLLHKNGTFDKIDFERGTVAQLGQIYVLFLRISIIAPCASLEIYKGEPSTIYEDVRFCATRDHSGQLESIIKDVESVLKSFDIEKLDDRQLSTIVPWTSLPYTEDGSDTVFDCLFDEFVDEPNSPEVNSLDVLPEPRSR